MSNERNSKSLLVFAVILTAAAVILGSVVIYFVLLENNLSSIGPNEASPRELPTLFPTAVPLDNATKQDGLNQSDQENLKKWIYTKEAPILLTYLTQNSNNLVELLNLYGDNQSVLFDSEWRKLMKETLSVEESIIGEIQALEPTPDLQSIHNEMLSFSYERSTALALIHEFLDTYDYSYLEIAAEHILNATEHSEKVALLLADLVDQETP